jgi:hypothetical protein
VVGHLGVPGFYCGWNAATGIPLNIQHRGTQDINFHTGGAGPAFQRMTILGTASGPTAGFVGIGNAAPAYRLDVQDNINVNTTGFGNGYRINGFTVVQIPGVENTFVGRGTGANFVGPLGANTFIGFQAGGSMVGASNSGDRNTFVGRASGYAMINGRHNTFIGCDAGLNMVSGNSNTFVGEHAGFLQSSGNNNTYVGSHSGQGQGSSTGNDNTFIGLNCGPDINNGNRNTFSGVRAGNSCTTGSENCFYGMWAGLQTDAGTGNVSMGYRAFRFNRNGNNNTFIGTDAGIPGAAVFWNLVNASGFGYNAIARDSNVMILGNNQVNVGIGLSNDITPANGPTNKLEIDAGLNLTDAQPTGQPGLSGLTFRDLHLGNTPSTPNGVTLSVDSTGEVILVKGGSIAGANNGLTISTVDSSLIVWGQDVGAPGNPGQLLNDREIPTDSFNVFFTDPAVSAVNQNRVQFGNYTGLSPFPIFAKVTAINGENSAALQKFGGLFTTTSDFNPSSMPVQFSPFYFGSITLNYKFGIVAIAQDNSNSAGRYIGVSGGAFSTVSQNNVGVSGKAHGSPALNTGVTGLAGGTDVGAVYYGVSGGSSGSGTNIGIYGTASGGTADYAGYFDGDVYVNGGANSGTGYLVASDQNIKTNIDTIGSALSIISQLQPKTFYFDTLNTHNLKLPVQKQYGLIAQQVEPILPELVSTATKPADYDSAGNLAHAAYTYKTLNYDAFISILLKGMQEQQQQLDSLKNQLSSCCSSNARTQNPDVDITDVTLTNTENVVLNQNIPNPFAEQTTITYFLPDNVQKAQLLFYDAQGKLIKAVDLIGRGNGQINVFADDLSNGIYTYALIIDGQVADSKKMMKAK